MVIKLLKENPDDRRAVLQMWDANKDLARVSKDVPCNTNIYFKIRDGVLNMTVCNRSNDMLWGAYGANVVHMSVLQELVAHRLGVPVGVYRQVSDSFHVYLNEVWDRVKHLSIDAYSIRAAANPYDTLYNYQQSDLFIEYDCLEWEHERFFNYHPADIVGADNWVNPCYRDIAVPMAHTYFLYKSGKYDEAYKHCEKIIPADWKDACLSWLRTREERKNKLAEEGE